MWSDYSILNSYLWFKHTNVSFTNDYYVSLLWAYVTSFIGFGVETALRQDQRPHFDRLSERTSAGSLMTLRLSDYDMLGDCT